MKYYLYIILTQDNTLYTGIALDVKKRFIQHQEKKGAKYTISHKPKQIVYLDVFENKSLALSEEYRIKKTLKRQQKLELIEKNKSKTKELLSLLDI